MSTLSRLFNPDRLTAIDPNKPENQPLMAKDQELRNQAFVRWHDEVGCYLIEGLEKALIGKIVRAIGHKRNTVDEVISNIRLLDEIERDLSFVDRIIGAFEEEEKRKKQG